MSNFGFRKSCFDEQDLVEARKNHPAWRSMQRKVSPFDFQTDVLLVKNGVQLGTHHRRTAKQDRDPTASHRRHCFSTAVL
jgi:hypothetical protein